jgi:TolB-like protein/Flp pilus assembly protein TadD
MVTVALLSIVIVAASAAAWVWAARPRGATPAVTASIAVLPFADMSQAKDQEYFSDGLSAELLGVLAKNPRLRVIGRTSSFQFKGKQEDIKTIGQRLGVDHVLEGTVRRDGDRVRIGVQLIKASDRTNVWADTYDRTVVDVFKVQDEIAASVSEALNVTLPGVTPVRRAPTTVAAYNFYLEGRHFQERRTAADYERAIAAYNKAIAADPGFAAPWAGLAWSYAQQAANGIIPTELGSQKARDAANRALTLDARLPEAYSAIVYIQTGFDWDWVGAAATVKHLLSLDPGNVETLYSAAMSARTLGRFDEAIAHYEQVMTLDPLALRSRNNLGLALYYGGRLSEAEEQFRKLLELRPGFGAAHCQLGKVLLARGKPEEALAAILQESSDVWRSICLPLAYHALGRHADSEAALGELTAKYAGDWAFQIAEVQAFRGEIDDAFAWLDRAFRQRDGGLSEMKGDPLLRNLETDPRHKAWLQKLGLPI